MFSFVGFSLLVSSLFYGVLDYAKFFLALAVSLCPVLAITTTFGVCTAIGWRTNSAMLIMPFLYIYLFYGFKLRLTFRICGIGVNDAFLMTHAWNRSARRRLEPSKRLGFDLFSIKIINVY